MELLGGNGKNMTEKFIITDVFFLFLNHGHVMTLYHEFSW